MGETGGLNANDYLQDLINISTQAAKRGHRAKIFLIPISNAIKLPSITLS